MLMLTAIFENMKLLYFLIKFYDIIMLSYGKNFSTKEKNLNIGTVWFLTFITNRCNDDDDEDIRQEL